MMSMFGFPDTHIRLPRSSETPSPKTVYFHPLIIVSNILMSNATCPLIFNIASVLSYNSVVKVALSVLLFDSTT